MKIDFTKLELQVINYALELSYSDRKPKYQKIIHRAQSKILKLDFEQIYDID
ncbi:MAG: hypothetical protein Tp123DCM300541_29 [Prokaryotic dsDNA virus sp.]|nr:MAG: hypothetical protein Tp123DCM300541_29 [Prokaryotic dsDNA virus sp.]QDP53788.1 MAG: hypothetical protein Tp125DCM6481_13 [Prokaryotic dsDNA virus sp.]